MDLIPGPAVCDDFLGISGSPDMNGTQRRARILLLYNYGHDCNFILVPRFDLMLATRLGYIM
jgi:hypothetical protein